MTIIPIMTNQQFAALVAANIAAEIARQVGK